MIVRSNLLIDELDTAPYFGRTEEQLIFVQYEAFAHVLSQIGMNRVVSFCQTRIRSVGKLRKGGPFHGPRATRDGFFG
jgi:hypothetical protein